jgi:hypothetical protein
MLSVNKNIVPIILLIGAILSALSCASRVDYNFPILIFAFFLYTSAKVSNWKLSRKMNILFLNKLF